MIKAVLFDLDGTLINTNELIIETFKHTLKTCLNVEGKREDIVSTFGEPLRDALERYDAENTEEMIKIYREYNETHHDKLAKAIDGVESGIKKLKETGVKLAVVTSKGRRTAVRGLKLFKLEDYFDIIITPEDTEKHKPLPDPALKACEVLGISPKEALMVGDSHNDILCGKNAGCNTCLVRYTAIPLDGIVKYNPDYVIDSVEEIADICSGK